MSATTVEHLAVGPQPLRRACFCATRTCDVVYFSEDGTLVAKDAVRVPVFEKATGSARPVCYCFGHSVGDVLAASRPDGSNAIVEAIRDACRRGEDRCEKTNPRGRCCLGNIGAVLGTASTCGGAG